MSNSKLTAALIATNVVTLAAVGYLSFSGQQNKHEAQYPLLDIARDFVDQKDFIVNIQPLREQVRELAGQYDPQSISIYIEFLNTGANISINPDTRIWAASLGKLPLAMVVMKKIELGTWKLSNELVLFKEDKDTKSSDAPDPLFQYPEGTRFTIEKLLQYLLTYSDNTAANILARNLNEAEEQALINDLGIEDLFSPEGKMSAKEHSRLFRSLYTSSFLKQENSERILKLLIDSPFKEFISRGLPPNLTFAHKYGESISDNVIADSGIVYIPRRPYLVNIMIKKPNGSESEDIRAKALMEKIGELTSNYFSGYED